MSIATTISSPRKIDRIRDGETRIVLRNIDWATYEGLVQSLNEQHVRLTYDRGTLELMSPSSRHEQYKVYCGHFIDDLAQEWDAIEECRSFAETTWRRVHVAKGLEADLCYYFDPIKLAALQGRLPDRPDDPLPDLAIEIEVSSSAMDKMAIYATLGFAEVWRTDGETASFEQLTPEGVYRHGERSLFLPVTPEDWLQWLWQSDEAIGKNERRRSFRAWIQDELRNRVS